MNIREILKGIYYCGVDDRNDHLFENLWPLPYGVSYNSYIVADEKIALIDTVHISEAELYAQNLREILGERRPDYLIINHMEPDHSGCIRLVRSLYPDIKIVGNRITVSMVKGYYDIPDDAFLVIADGEELSLGNKTLRFHLTPMVHWPETMMTYIPEDALIFTGDAFGCFGALNGGIIDREMDCELYFREMYRYYSNIVGKYGVHVQRALKKAAPLKPEYICPTHGPVWNEEIDKVIDIYDRLSRYDAEKGVVIVYASMYGNTGRLAQEIGMAVSQRGIKHVKIHNAVESPLSDILADIFRYKGLIIGSPTYSMHLFPPIEQLMIALETRELKGRALAVFGSFTWAGVAPRILAEYAQKMKIPVLASLEMKQAQTKDVEKAVEELADAVVNAL